jgi:hypothetical protein
LEWEKLEMLTQGRKERQEKSLRPLRLGVRFFPPKLENPKLKGEAFHDSSQLCTGQRYGDCGAP